MHNGSGSLAFDRLYQGDCLEHFQRVESGSIDLVFADPPFNIGYDYDVYNDRRDADQYLEWTQQWAAEVARVDALCREQRAVRRIQRVQRRAAAEQRRLLGGQSGRAKQGQDRAASS